MNEQSPLNIIINSHNNNTSKEGCRRNRRHPRVLSLWNKIEMNEKYDLSVFREEYISIHKQFQVLK